MHDAVSMHVHLHLWTMYMLCIQHRDISGAIGNNKKHLCMHQSSTQASRYASYLFYHTLHLSLATSLHNSHGLLVDVMD
jgi:hypothetical protein